MNSSEIFHGRYELLKRIGSGGFSEVWKALDMRSGLEVAIKIFRKQDEEGILLCRDEFLKTYEFRHPNILVPFHFDVDNDRPYLIMKYVTGGTVSEKAGKMNDEEIDRLVLQLSSALKYLHTLQVPVIHGDVKPDNILIDGEGNFLLTDFGISTRLEQKFTQTMVSDPFASGDKGVTPMAYRSPETFRYKNWESQIPGPHSDIWSAGVTLYQVIYDALPFNGEGGLGQLIMMKSGYNHLQDILDFSQEEYSRHQPILLSALQLEPEKRSNVLGEITPDYKPIFEQQQEVKTEIKEVPEKISFQKSKKKESKAWIYGLLVALVLSSIMVALTFIKKRNIDETEASFNQPTVNKIDEDTMLKYTSTENNPMAPPGQTETPDAGQLVSKPEKKLSESQMIFHPSIKSSVNGNEENRATNTQTTVKTEELKNTVLPVSEAEKKEVSSVSITNTPSEPVAEVKPEVSSTKMAIVKPNIPVPLALNETISDAGKYQSGSKIQFVVASNVVSYGDVVLRKGQVVYATVRRSNKNKISIRFPEVYSSGGTKLKDLNLDNFEIDVPKDNKGKIFTPVTSGYQKNVQIQ
ncbi:MAG: serine/threonine protein kinase [Saprospiraceae bacterium]|nr:serine/threonine protein kinase [Saprospiraceae bacterium]